MNNTLTAERIAALCAPPPGYVKPEAKAPSQELLKKPRKRIPGKNWNPAVRKPIAKYQVNKEMMARIQEWRKTNPWHNYREIADHFKCSISTAYYSLNRPKNAS